MSDEKSEEKELPFIDPNSGAAPQPGGVAPAGAVAEEDGGDSESKSAKKSSSSGSKSGSKSGGKS